MAACSSCGKGTIITDPEKDFRVCNACGIVYSEGVYRDEIFTSDGVPTAAFVHSFGDFDHRERRQYRARALFSDVSSTLGLSGRRAADAVRLASDAMDGRLPLVPAVAAASSYLAARQHSIPLPLAEAASAVGEEPRAIGRIASRLSHNLDLPPSPPVDPTLSVSRALRASSSFCALDRRKADEIVNEGRFLFQCATKWFLLTGRQPMPLVAAVAAFVAEINKVDASIEDISREIYAGVATSKRRYKELVGTLVRVAKVLLPWGQDVDAKSLIHHAPLLIRLMERKSKLKPRSQGESFDGSVFDFNEFLNANPMFGSEEDCKYFRVANCDQEEHEFSVEKAEKLRISVESLTSAYKRALERLANCRTIGDTGNVQGKKGKKLDVDAWLDSLKDKGRWNSNKRLTLEQVIQADVGYNSLPPSFLSGLESCKMRRLKIESAKRRIDEIMKPCLKAIELGVDENMKSCSKAIELQINEILKPCLRGNKLGELEPLLVRKKRKRVSEDAVGVDWEDCVIELLLLHGVHEEEIEQGQYRRLLDLHVLNP